MSIVETWFDQVWNQGNEAAIDNHLAPAAVIHGLVDLEGKPITSPDGFKAMFRAFRSALPDIRVQLEETVIEGEKQVALCQVTGTHTGDGLGRTPLGKRVSFSGMTMARVRDGKIIEAWNFYDFPAMFQQME